MADKVIRRVDIPHQFSGNERVGVGLSAWVLPVDAVAKCYTDDRERDREVAVYERLGSHESILKYYGLLDGSVLLQFAPHGTIRQYLEKSRLHTPHRPPAPPLATRLRWAEQTAQAIAHLHSRGVFHCDISCSYIFLDANLNALVGDFAGSAIDEKEPFGWYGTSHHHPDADDASEETEIFALGSAFYEIMTGRDPFDGYSAPAEVENAIRNYTFPSLDHLPALESVIRKCWRGNYKSVDDLLQDLKRDGTAHSCLNPPFS